MRPHVTRSAPPRHAGGPLRGRVAAAVLVTLTAGVFGACADSPTATSGASPRAAPVLADAQALATGELLWDQTSTWVKNTSLFVTGTVLDFSNDFVVPAGQIWTVSQVVIAGATSTSEVVPATLTLTIRTNNSGLPGPGIIYSATLSSTAVQLVSQSLAHYTYTLPAPVELAAGTYWFGYNCDPYITLFRCGLATVVGYNSYYTVDGETWHLYANGDLDLAFALYGTAETEAEHATAELQTTLAGLSLPAGTYASLSAKLREVLAAAAAGNTAAACRGLTDFINQVNALAGKKKLTLADAQTLIQEANEIRALLGC